MEVLTRPMPSDQALTSDQHRPRYSIIIPAYNESARVGATLERVLAYVTEQGWDAEVIAVDDGSRDNTSEIIRSYAQKNPRLRLLQNPGNRGKGYSVRNGMLHARGKSCYSAMRTFRPLSRKRKNYWRQSQTVPTSPLVRAGCAAIYKLNASRSTASSSGGFSISCCALRWASSSKTHSADLRPLPAGRLG